MLMLRGRREVLDISSSGESGCVFTGAGFQEVFALVHVRPRVEVSCGKNHRLCRSCLIK
jgi:hypothetical protein